MFPTRMAFRCRPVFGVVAGLHFFKILFLLVIIVVNICQKQFAPGSIFRYLFYQ